MKENRHEVEIQGSVAEVWGVLTNLEQYAEWNPLLYRAAGKVELGAQVELAAKTASRDMNFTCEVVKVEPPQEFSWKFHVVMPFLFRGEHIFRLEEIDAQRVRFIDREIFQGLLVPLQAQDIETNAKAGMIAMGAALKARVEAR